MMDETFLDLELVSLETTGAERPEIVRSPWERRVVHLDDGKRVVVCPFCRRAFIMSAVR